MNISTIGISFILPNYLITYITYSFIIDEQRASDSIWIYFQVCFFLRRRNTIPIRMSIYGFPGDRRWVSANCYVIMKLRCCQKQKKKNIPKDHGKVVNVKKAIESCTWLHHDLLRCLFSFILFWFDLENSLRTIYKKKDEQWKHS